MTNVMDTPIDPPWWRKPYVLPALSVGGGVLVIVLLTLAFSSFREPSLRTPLANVTISEVAQGTFRDFVPLHGRVVPKDTIYLDVLEGGQVAQVLVQAGDQVKAGQPLVVFRNTTLELDVLSRQGSIVQSINSLQQQETSLEAARVANAKALLDIQYNITQLEHTVARYQRLLTDGAISQREAEKASDDLAHQQELLPLQQDASKRQEALRLKTLPGLQAQLADLQKSLQVTRGKLDDLTVKAPVAGKITTLDLKIGENVNRGQRISEIIPPTGFKIAADIDEFYLNRMRAGQDADIEIDGKTYKLKVARIYPQVKNGVFQADFVFDGKAPEALTAGATVEGKLSLGADGQALILPSGAFLEASGGDYVFVVDAGGSSAHRRRVRLGRRNVEQIEVLEGLAAGDRVITSDYSSYEKVDRIDLST